MRRLALRLASSVTSPDFVKARSRSLGAPACMAAVLALTVCVAPSLTAVARTGLMGDFVSNAADLESKIVGLAKAMPASAYGWRPADGVRTTGEVLKHVAADNYFLPAAMGTAPPPETGISAKDYKTTFTYEARPLTRDQIIAELEQSFAFLRSSMAGFDEAKLEAPLQAFGQTRTHRSLWLSTTTHLHEHLGQLIAYARSNKVTPPWSK